MVEQANAAECHGNAVFVAGVDHLLVANGAAGLHNGSHAAAMGALDVVAKREEGIAAHAHARYMAQILALFGLGKRGGLLGEGFGPHIVTDHILGVIAQIHINGVVAVGLGNVGTERQIQHLVHVAQLPVIGLLACQTGAVDAALLPCT